MLDSRVAGQWLEGRPLHRAGAIRTVAEPWRAWMVDYLDFSGHSWDRRQWIADDSRAAREASGRLLRVAAFADKVFEERSFLDLGEAWHSGSWEYVYGARGEGGGEAFRAICLWVLSRAGPLSQDLSVSVAEESLVRRFGLVNHPETKPPGCRVPPSPAPP